MHQGIATTIYGGSGIATDGEVNLQVEALRHRDNGCGNRSVARTVRQVGDERAVQLEFVHRQLGQITQRGITGAKAINGHTQRLEFAEDTDSLVDIIHQHAFGYFQFQAGFRQHTTDHLHQIAITKLARRQIDGYGLVGDTGGLQGLELKTGLSQDNLTDLDYQPGQRVIERQFFHLCLGFNTVADILDIKHDMTQSAQIIGNRGYRTLLPEMSAIFPFADHEGFPAGA